MIMASSSLVVVGTSTMIVLMLTFLSVSADDHVDQMMMAAPEPEAEFDLATSRARVNQDPATLSRAELRFGNYLPLLGRGRRLLDGHSEEAEDMEEMMAPASYDDRRRQLLDSEEAAAAPAPTEDEEGTLELATERGRLGGRTGMNFGTGTLYTQNRFDNRRRLLEAEDDHDDHDHDHDHEAEAEPAAAVVDGEMASMMMMMAPEPEMDLATTRARLAFSPGRSFDVTSSPEFLAALGQSGAGIIGNGRRRQLLGEEMESEMMMMAPEPEVDLATERGRIGGRTGFNFGTGQLYTQNRFD